MANPQTFEAEISSAQQALSTNSFIEENVHGALLPSSPALTQAADEENLSWNELLFGNLFAKKPEPKRRIVKAIPPLSSSESSAPPTTSVQAKSKDDVLDDEANATEVDPVQMQKEERRRSAQERQRKLHAQKLQERRLSSSPKMPPIEKVANPMSRFLSVFSIHAHPEHKRRAGPPTIEEDEDSALLLSPKRPRSMEEGKTVDTVESPKEPEDRASQVQHRVGYFVLALGIVVTGFLFQQMRRNARSQLEL